MADVYVCLWLIYTCTETYAHLQRSTQNTDNEQYTLVTSAVGDWQSTSYLAPIHQSPIQRSIKATWCMVYALRGLVDHVHTCALWLHNELVKSCQKQMGKSPKHSAWFTHIRTLSGGQPNIGFETVSKLLCGDWVQKGTKDYCQWCQDVR